MSTVEEKPNANARTANTKTGNTQGVDQPASSNVTGVGGQTDSISAVAGARQASVQGRRANRSKPSQGRSNAKGVKSTDSAAPKAGWRHSDTTTFIEGILLVGVLVYCGAVYAANHHELKAWMVAVGVAIGVVGTLVLMDGGDD